MKKKKTVIIMGGGPAGLTAGLALLEQGNDYLPVILEELEDVGGISRTLFHNGNRMDIGGHRFFSKDSSIMDWWLSLIPLQGAQSKDDLILGNEKPLSEYGPDPERDDCVTLLRHRISRILYRRRFFDYPISIKPSTLINMGFINTLKAGFGYLRAIILKRPENSLEDYIINRFGTTLYHMFFEDYTEKVWGVHPSNIDASWGAQRIKGLSLTKTVINALAGIFKKADESDISQTGKETSLIEQFLYPKYGPGQLWETAAQKLVNEGGIIYNNCKVIGVNTDGHLIKSVTVTKDGGNPEEIYGDYFLSSIPIKDLVSFINDADIPLEVSQTARDLPYRDFITVGLLLDKIRLKNMTKIKTVANILPDTWIYIQEKDVKVGRMQIFNNWSPYMVKNCEQTVWIGLEYFCNEDDYMWNMSDEEFITFAINEMVQLDIINKDDVIDSVRVKVQKAYPAYFGSYGQFDKVREFLDLFPNLSCIGRNGQHRYNNMDHSMLTAFEAVKNIVSGSGDKSNIWSVNSDKSYHEQKKHTL